MRSALVNVRLFHNVRRDFLVHTCGDRQQVSGDGGRTAGSSEIAALFFRPHGRPADWLLRVFAGLNALSRGLVRNY